MSNEAGPQEVYSARQAQYAGEESLLEKQHYAMGNARIAVFGVALALAYLAFGQSLFSGVWLVVPVVMFVLLAMRHEHILKAKGRANRLVRFYEQGLRRLEDRWAGYGVSGTAFSDPEHPYARDLDLFGKGSLFELLCTARTKAGQQCLAKWLCAPADPITIRARQEAIEELRPNLTLREDMVVLGEEIRQGLHPEALIAWGRQPVEEALLRLSSVVRVCIVCNIAATVFWALGYGPLVLTSLLLIEQLVFWKHREAVRRIIGEVEQPGRDLELFSLLLERLEKEQFASPLLKSLTTSLEKQGLPPSARIAQLYRLIETLDLRRNQLLMPVLLVLLWTLRCACNIEVWRSKNGPELEQWLRVMGEFEALSALAGYAYEHPADPFPEIVESGSLYEGESLGHPLLSETACVRNDVRLDAERRLYIVSGSNMSGKSTYLRTVGINAVLALAGAPVRAKWLRLSPLHLGASIQTNDSLQAGMSRFYAEIVRLRQVVDITSGTLPLLFLLDEILHGTNSHDRRVGAEAVIHALLARDAMGLITTHDLALARIAEEMAPRAANVHFADDLLDGKMHFDYRLHQGVGTKSNAIELMRAVGLEV